MWDPDVIATKQKALVKQVYGILLVITPLHNYQVTRSNDCKGIFSPGEQLMVPEWYPRLQTAERPSWLKFVPSPAAVSFNFAMSQYHPLTYTRHNKDRHTWANTDFLDALGSCCVVTSFFCSLTRIPQCEPVVPDVICR